MVCCMGGGKNILYNVVDLSILLLVINLNTVRNQVRVKSFIVVFNNNNNYIRTKIVRLRLLFRLVPMYVWLMTSGVKKIRHPVNIHEKIFRKKIA